MPVDLTCNHFGIARIPRTDNVEFFDPNYRYSFKEWQDWSFKQTDNKGFTRSSLTVLSGTEGKKQVDEACLGFMDALWMALIYMRWKTVLPL